jgi:hypothetical protein
LLQALDASRENASHFENVYSYWSSNINSYRDDDDCSRDYDSVDTLSYGSNGIPSLSTVSSCMSSEKNSICAKLTKMIMRRAEEEEAEFEEHQEHQQQQQQHLLQPKLLKFTNNGFSGCGCCGKSRGGSKSDNESVEVVAKTTATATAAIATTQQ